LIEGGMSVDRFSVRRKFGFAGISDMEKPQRKGWSMRHFGSVGKMVRPLVSVYRDAP
jgi:hypothetical protein